jgi:hypothetical protein
MELVMATPDSLTGPPKGTALGSDASAERRDEPELTGLRTGGISEAARSGWEGAWIDLGGEG